MYDTISKTEMRKRFHEAIKSGEMSRQEVNRACEVIGMTYKPPIEVSAEGYLYNRGPHQLSICQHHYGVNDSLLDSEKYVDTWLQNRITERFGPAWGGTKVKVTIEEVL